MGSLPGGVTKREYLDYQIRSSLAEGNQFDLIAMGRSEGPGCYCAVNHNLREVIDDISARIINMWLSTMKPAWSISAGERLAMCSTC